VAERAAAGVFGPGRIGSLVLMAVEAPEDESDVIGRGRRALDQLFRAQAFAGDQQPQVYLGQAIRYEAKQRP